eukprot:TRINITY_DN52886_c0_g1_i1.p1 TRINITY_DN52886_c0_g1~~TRINITY_DN52886_c0_g1_i1.p1  ORF type:complete len:498 (+),score=97.72 TRINITY_DN52886_c0_g1_i1:10-1503(+)
MLAACPSCHRAASDGCLKAVSRRTADYPWTACTRVSQNGVGLIALASAGVAAFTLRPRKISSSSRRPALPRHAAPSLQSCEVEKQTDLSSLFEWLVTCGAKGLGNVNVRPSNFEGAGNGVFPMLDLAKDDVFMAMPYSACLTAGEDGQLGMGAALAAKLLYEKRQGEASQYRHYLAVLPTEKDLAGHPLLWPRGASWQSVLSSCPQSLRMLRHARMRASSEAQALVTSGAAQTIMEAKWALAIVESRAVMLGDGSPEWPLRLALCPIIDLLNHDVLDAGASSSCTFLDAPDQEMVVLQAAGQVQKSEELCLVYEHCSAAQLFARYGFLQQAPQVESCLLEVPIIDPEQLPGGQDAQAARIELLRKAGWRRSAWRTLLLKLPDSVQAEGSLLGVARLAVLPHAEAVRQFGMAALGGQQLESLGCSKDAANAVEQAARLLADHWIQLALARVDDCLVRLDSTPDAGMPRDQRDSVKGLLQIERGVLEVSLGMLSAVHGS